MTTNGIADPTVLVKPNGNGSTPEVEVGVEETECYKIGQYETEFPLTASQLSALPHLLSAPRISQAAAAAGVSRSTIYRWLDDLTFKYELDRCREAAMNEALHALKGMLIQSVSAVAELLQSDDERVRLGAARLALTYGFRVMENQDIVRRLDMLENSVTLWKERNRRAY